VTRRARLDDRRRLQLRFVRFRIVNRMAGHTRQVASIVHAALEIRVIAPVVTTETHLGSVAWRHRRDSADLRRVSAGFSMGLARAVTGFTRPTVLGGRRPWIVCLAMKRLLQRLAFRIMTSRARVVAGVATALHGCSASWRWQRGVIRLCN